MTQRAIVYGEALYDLASAENLSGEILGQIAVLEESFRQEPAFLKLLQSPNLSKQERCDIIDGSFRRKVHQYVLNFLKILTEKGCICHYSQCVKAYRDRYNVDHNILPVTAVTAVALTAAQTDRLTEKLCQLIGKTVTLTNRVDPGILGGVRLDYDGKRLDDTIAHRLDAVRSVLRSTVL